MFSANQNTSSTYRFKISVNSQCCQCQLYSYSYSSWYVLLKLVLTRINAFHDLQLTSVIIIFLSDSQMGNMFVFLILSSDGKKYLFHSTSDFELRPASILSLRYSQMRSCSWWYFPSAQVFRWLFQHSVSTLPCAYCKLWYTHTKKVLVRSSFFPFTCKTNVNYNCISFLPK